MKIIWNNEERTEATIIGGLLWWKWRAVVKSTGAGYWYYFVNDLPGAPEPEIPFSLKKLLTKRQTRTYYSELPRMKLLKK